MEEARIQALIQRVREQLQRQEPFPAEIKAGQVARQAESFFESMDNDMRELRIYGRTHPDVIKLREDLAKCFLRCGDICFAENKNDTSLNDKMLGLANRSVLGIDHSLQARFDDDYQRNHWHGW
jgi:hypothetical protein